MLHCALAVRIFRIEGLYLIITRVVMFGHAFDHWRDCGFSRYYRNFRGKETRGVFTFTEAYLYAKVRRILPDYI